MLQFPRPFTDPPNDNPLSWMDAKIRETNFDKAPKNSTSKIEIGRVAKILLFQKQMCNSARRDGPMYKEDDCFVLRGIFDSLLRSNDGGEAGLSLTVASILTHDFLLLASGLKKLKIPL